jgi:hypothetical protein
VFALGRSDALARGGDAAAGQFERRQYGLALSGPILRDRLHFLVASELQRLESPMLGPFVGQADAASAPVPVRSADLSRLDSALRFYGLEAGSAGAVDNRNRIRGLFARVDAALPELNGRAVLWVNDSDTRSLAFSRLAAPDTFALSSQAAEVSFGTRTVALQLYNSLRRAGGGQNELSVSRRSIPFQAIPEVRQPIVRVEVPGASGGLTTLVTGSAPQAQGGVMRSSDVSARNDLTLPFGAAHVVSVGVEAEWFHIEPGSLQNAYGTWTFASLDSLEAGLPARFELARDFGSAGVPVSGTQLAAYAGDRWQLAERVSLTLGLRADRLAVRGVAPYNALVDSLFGRRTDVGFGRAVPLSPRLGFTWDLHGTGRDQLRGGVGVFTGRPPLAWYHVALQNYGDGIGTLRCGSRPGDLGLPPAFRPDPLDPPVACAGGTGLDAPPSGDVELVQPDLAMARTLRGVLAYERRLPGRLVGTLEGLVTRNLADFALENLNLVGPQATDRRGRVIYGGFDDLGRARPSRVTERLPSVVELRNVSRNYAVQLSASVARQFEGGVAATASYTWSRVRDVQTPLRVNNRGLVNWALRAVSGRHDEPTPGISLNDVPHRIVLAGTWRAPWRRWLTELSVLYVGESGSPFTYRAGGAGGRGDLNADGALNDPVYVPRSALDPDEITFTGASADPGADNSPAAREARALAQRLAFEEFIGSSACLRHRRGTIVERNGCREPWAHTTAASLRQLVPIGARALELQLDIFNPLNLLDGGWGRRRLANPVLLEHVGQLPGPAGEPEPVFRFAESAAEWTTELSESAFQLQLGARYRF